MTTRLSIGTAGFGNEYELMDELECKKIIDKALTNRLIYIDTAPHYGNGLSENILGKCLKKHSRETYIISTKAGRMGNTFDYSYMGIRQSVFNSLKRLELKYIDIVYLHDIEYASSLDIILKESLPALAYLQKQGYIRYIGVSGLYLNQLDYIIYNYPIQYVLTYCCYTLINDSLKNYAPKWKDKGVTIVQGGVTSMGLLTPIGPPDWHPASYDIKSICKKITNFCNENNINIVEKSFYYSYLYTKIDYLLVGVTSVKQLEEYIHWLDHLYTNNKTFINTLLEMATPIKNKLWEK